MPKVSDNVRKRLSQAFKEIRACRFSDELEFNRLSGAVLWKLERHPDPLNEDQMVNFGVDLMGKDQLPVLFAEYDAHLGKKKENARKQVLGIVTNLIPKDVDDRQQVIESTVEMIQQINRHLSIRDIRTLVIARINNGHKDVDEEVLDSNS